MQGPGFEPRTPPKKKSRCSFMPLFWFASSWVIWKQKNDRLFRGIENSPIQLVESIKLLSFWWYKYSFYN